MSKKMMLLALAAVSATMFALPAAASAGNWKIHPEKVGFTISGGQGVLTVHTDNDTVTCTKTTGLGSYSDDVTGSISLVFTGCKAAGIACTTPGEASGTITTTGHFTNVYLSSGKTTPGITITGPGGSTTETLAAFKCAFGLVSVHVTGSINGHVEKECNEGKTESTSAIEFASEETEGTPLWPHVTGDTTKTTDILTVRKNGVDLPGGSIDATGTIHFTEPAGATCV